MALHFPSTWPPESETVILEYPHDHGRLQLTALQERRLRFQLFDEHAHEVESFTSQPVDFVGQGRFGVLVAAWSPAGVTLRIQGTTLAGGSHKVVQIALSDKTPSGDFSFNHPDATIACQKWIDNRIAKFAKPAPLRRDRYKTTQEKAEDLHRSMQCLREIGEQILNGKAYLLGLLASELRALLYWQEDGKKDRQYNPLLLHMAHLPRPVYRVQAHPFPLSMPIPDVHLEPDIPRLRRTFPRDELVDVQEWLATTVLHVKHGKDYIAKDVIADFADSLGAAHYDEDISQLD